MKEKLLKIALAHVYADDNKGDLGIIQSTVLGIKEVLASNGVAAKITAISMFREKDTRIDRTHRLLRTIVDSISSAPLTQKYEESRGVARSILKLTELIVQLITSLLSIYLLKVSGKYCVNKGVLSIYDSDVLICKGGSLLHCDGSARAHLFLMRMLVPLWVSTSFKIPSFIFGQSIGPFSTSLSKYLMRRIGNLCTKIYVRDQTSFDYLIDIGLSEKAIGIVPDPAFHLREFVREMDHERDKVIGVTCLNVTRDEIAQQEYEEMVVKVLLSFSKKNQGWGIRFFPQVIGPDSWQDDRIVSLRLAEKIKKVSNIVVEVDNRDFTPLELCQEYSKIGVLFGSRLHSTIFASVVNTPAVVIEYQQAKAKGALNWLNRPEWVFHYSSSWECVEEALNRLVNELPAEKNKIEERGRYLSRLVRQEIAGMFDLVKASYGFPQKRDRL